MQPLKRMCKMTETEKLQWWKEHAESLDRNWETHHEACMNAIYEACGLTNGDVPAAVRVIEGLRKQRDALLVACLAVQAHLSTTFPPYPPGDSPYDKVRAAIALHEPPDPSPIDLEELEREPTH